MRRGRASGSAAPTAITGRGVGLRSPSRRKTLTVPCSTGTLPATVVTASTLISGELQPIRSASASSIPGSVSIRTGAAMARV
ncbi:MAG: hypothetical protein AUG87_02165 [Candidatus Rokubacteria bacterium 13_1_20CM_4_70_14]|nr:MAG: hypothetical protein AUG87_02165 [Candidatus Rokubacteria bacterium 13_1_20CM_4_70_14]